MATVKQIADHLRVSSATVSRVLNSRPGIAPSTRRRVLSAANKLGRERNVGLKASRYIGFVHPLGQFIGNIGEYHAALLGGMGQALGQQQYDLALIDPYRDKRPDETYTQFFMRKDLLGVIIQVRPRNVPMVEAIAQEGFPMLVVASRHEHPKVNWLVVDSASQYVAAVEHLYHLGHRRIALAVRDPRDYDHDERVRGFMEGCRRFKLPVDPALCWTVTGDVSSGASVIRRMSSLPDRPTAVVFTNGAPTRGALRACAELGWSVPGDLSIVGFDDSTRRYEAAPTYTSVCQDAEALGLEAASLMGRILDGTIAQPVHAVLPGLFEVHQSTGAPSPALRC